MSSIDAPEKQIRYVELDSLRGLAALTILVDHLAMVWIELSPPAAAISRFPLALLILVAPGALILFFVLSGFVLSLPAVDGKPQPYFTFVTRRVFRIYVPYLAALAISVAASYWVNAHVTNSYCVSYCWREPVSWRLVWQHVMFLGEYDASRIDAPIWSLVYEMRISLIFPFLCALVLRLKYRWAFALALVLTCVARAIDRIHGTDTGIQIADTLHYSTLFILGICLARERARIALWFSRLTRLAKIAFAVACVLLIAFAGQLFSSLAVWLTHRGFSLISQWFTALGAGGLIVICMNSRFCKRILFWPPFHRLGQMAFSLYLLHFIVLQFCVRLLYGVIPLPAILCLIFVPSIIVSWYFYRGVIVPSINLGRRLSNAFQKPSAT